MCSKYLSKASLVNFKSAIKGVGGGSKFLSQIFFHTSLMKTTGYSKNKMGSTTSKLRTGQFLLTLEVGPYAQKMTRKWPKTAKNSQKRAFFGFYKMKKLITSLSNSYAFWHVARAQGYKKIVFFVFLIFGHFCPISGPFRPKKWKTHFLGPKWPGIGQKWPKIYNPKITNFLYPSALATCQEA